MCSGLSGGIFFVIAFSGYFYVPYYRAGAVFLVARRARNDGLFYCCPELARVH